MSEAWRDSLEAAGGVPPEAEALSGDIDLLVPVEPTWRVLDVSGAYAARAAVLAHRCAQVVAVAPDPAQLEVMTSRAQAFPRGRQVPLQGGDRLPFEVAEFDLLVYAEKGGPSLEQLLTFLKPGGWLVWIVEGAAPPTQLPEGWWEALETARKAALWVQERMSAPTLWRQRLNRLGFDETRIYVHVREYAWGYLPFDAYWLQRYYLESMQEEGADAGRGKAALARWLGKGGVYPFLTSAHVLVAHLPGELL